MTRENITIIEQLKSFDIPHLQTGKYMTVDEVKNRLSTRALQSLIPVTDGTDYCHPLVIEWYTRIMPQLQREGWNFHDAFSRASVLWNNSIYALEYGFRLPYDFGMDKMVSGRKVENPKSILRVIGASDNTMESIAKALSIPLESLWPEVINGKNQFETRRGDPEAMIYFWFHGGKEEYKKQMGQINESKIAFHRAMRVFNTKNPSHMIETDIKGNVRVRAFHAYLKAIGEL